MATVLAKLGSPVKLGEYGLANAISGPVFICSYLGLHSLLVTDSTNRFRFRDYFSLRLITSTSALILVSLIGFCIYGRITAEVICFVALGMWFDSLSDIIYAIFQSNKRADYVGRSMLLKGILNLSSLSLAMFLTRNVIWAAMGSSLASMVIVLFYDAPYGYKVLKNRSGGYTLPTSTFSLTTFDFRSLSVLTPVALAAIPLGLVGLFGSVTGCVPQFIIAKYLGDNQLGLYCAAAYLVNVGRVGVMAAGVAANPFLAGAFSTNNYTAYRNMVVKLVGLGLLLAITAPAAAALVGHKVMTILYTSQYAQSTVLIVMILLAGGVRYVTSMIGFSVTAARQYDIQVYWFGASLVVSVVTNLWFVPRMGLMGAAISAGITAAIELAIGCVILVNTIHGLKKRSEVKMVQEMACESVQM